MSQEYKWRLTWHGSKDSPKLRAAAKACETFPLWRDSKARLVGYEEYAKMVDNKEIAPPESYWQIESGQVGLVSLTYYRQYSNTWDLIGTCMSDFCNGWNACEKHIKELIHKSEKPCRLF